MRKIWTGEVNSAILFGLFTTLSVSEKYGDYKKRNISTIRSEKLKTWLRLVCCWTCCSAFVYISSDWYRLQIRTHKQKVSRDFKNVFIFLLYKCILSLSRKDFPTWRWENGTMKCILNILDISVGVSISFNTFWFFEGARTRVCQGTMAQQQTKNAHLVPNTKKEVLCLTYVILIYSLSMGPTF